MLRIVILLIFCLFVCSPISAQALADGSRSKPKPPSSLYDGYREDRVHAYIPVSDIPDRYPIHVSGFVMPLADVLVTSVYGMRCKKMHRGIDLALEVGDTIASAFEGYVRKTGYDYGGYGRFMVVRHLNGLETVYGHLQTCLLDEGTEVKSGQSIALGGNTGRSTGPHLHFEILFMGHAIDPRRIIDFAEKKVHQPSIIRRTTVSFQTSVPIKRRRFCAIGYRRETHCFPLPKSMPLRLTNYADTIILKETANCGKGKSSAIVNLELNGS